MNSPVKQQPMENFVHLFPDNIYVNPSSAAALGSPAFLDCSSYFNYAQHSPNGFNNTGSSNQSLASSPSSVNSPSGPVAAGPQLGCPQVSSTTHAADTSGLLGGGRHVHQCAICGDRSSGKHYGVFSCEGCKGFFKRTVRKSLSYICKEQKDCIVDKRQRNRCQYCRYKKCVAVGMRREGVQEEKLRGTRGGGGGKCPPPQAAAGSPQLPSPTDQSESSNANAAVDLIPMEKLIAAETTNRDSLALCSVPGDMGATRNKALQHVIEWAKNVPHFTDLLLEDQVLLLQWGWDQIILVDVCLNNGQLFVNLTPPDDPNEISPKAFKQICELAQILSSIGLDCGELACLKSIVLFNAYLRGLSKRLEVEKLQERFMRTLRELQMKRNGGNVQRFHRIILLLSTIRSTACKCLDNNTMLHLLSSNSISSVFTAGGNGSQSRSGGSPQSDFADFILGEECDESDMKGARSLALHLSTISDELTETFAHPN